jgi:hypothetical protein
MCLACSTPVRGRVLGDECLAEVLGAPAPEVRPRPRHALPGLRRLTGGAFAVAVLVTALPWSRYGMGSDAFGAWGRTPRWALLSALAAVAGLAVWLLARWIRGGYAPRWDAVLAVLGALTSAAAMLAMWHPPAFTHTWLGPWIAVAAGLVACLGSVAALRGARSGAPARS